MAKQHDLFLGRMQPITKAHAKIIKGMKNPVIILVKGKKSSQDKQANPFDSDTQIRLIQKVAPNAIVSVAPNGFLPGILGFLRKTQGIEIARVFAGTDRIEGYRNALEKANAKAKLGTEFTAEVVEIPRTGADISATKVRNAIREGDFETFKKMTPPQIHEEFATLQDIITGTKNNIAEGVLRFEDWLEEEATAVTGDVAKTDPPLFKGKVKKRKKLEDEKQCEGCGHDDLDESDFQE